MCVFKRLFFALALLLAFLAPRAWALNYETDCYQDAGTGSNWYGYYGKDIHLVLYFQATKGIAAGRYQFSVPCFQTTVYCDVDQGQIDREQLFGFWEFGVSHHGENTTTKKVDAYLPRYLNGNAANDDEDGTLTGSSTPTVLYPGTNTPKLCRFTGDTIYVNTITGPHSGFETVEGKAVFKAFPRQGTSNVHAAVTVQGNGARSVRLYIDGKLALTQPISTVFGQTTSFTVGGSFSGPVNTAFAYAWQAEVYNPATKAFEWVGTVTGQGYYSDGVELPPDTHTDQFTISGNVPLPSPSPSPSPTPTPGPTPRPSPSPEPSTPPRDPTAPGGGNPPSAPPATPPAAPAPQPNGSPNPSTGDVKVVNPNDFYEPFRRALKDSGNDRSYDGVQDFGTGPELAPVEGTTDLKKSVEDTDDKHKQMQVEFDKLKDAWTHMVDNLKAPKYPNVTGTATHISGTFYRNVPITIDWTPYASVISFIRGLLVGLIASGLWRALYRIFSTAGGGGN